MTDAEPQTSDTAPLLELREPLPGVVDDAAGLARTAETFASGSGPVAVDAERASGYRYSQRAYLVQLRREGAGTALVDPVPFGDVDEDGLAPLGEALVDAEWIIHAASQDLPCLAEVGLRPRRLFDTELAGRLLNFPRVGLAFLVEELLGFHLRKEHSAVDWSSRPLPEPWLLYAALDVEVLVELRDTLAERLVAAGKDEWARQEFAYWTTRPFPGPRTDPWRRTSGMHKVRGGRRGLAVVRALWQQRDQIARDRDTTPSRILNDAALVEIAQATVKQQGYDTVRAFRGRSGRRYRRRLEEAAQGALRLSDDELPSRHAPVEGPPPPRAWADRAPEAADRLQRCRDEVQRLSDEHDLPQENLLSPDHVRRLAWEPPVEPTAAAVGERLRELGSRPWQTELTASALAEAIVHQGGADA